MYNAIRKRGLFLVLDGIDGNGKTTQAKILKKYLEKKGYPIHLSEEPSKSEYGKQINILLRKKGAAKISKKRWVELFTLDRKENLKAIRTALKENKIIISERYYYSTLAYQLNEEEWSDYIKKFIKPDIVFILDTKPETAMKRLEEKYKKTKERKAYFEKLNILTKVRKKFLSLPQYINDNIKIINSDRKIPEISKDLLKEIEILL